MKYFLETHLPYSFLTFFALAVFYGIYFTKVLTQKRHGIQTRQIGRRKEKSIHTVEVLMGIVTLITPIAQLFSVVFGCNYCWLIADTKYDFISYQEKNIVDRMMPLVTMYLRLWCERKPEF